MLDKTMNLWYNYGNDTGIVSGIVTESETAKLG